MSFKSTIDHFFGFGLWHAREKENMRVTTYQIHWPPAKNNNTDSKKPRCPVIMSLYCKGDYFGKVDVQKVGPVSDERGV